MIILLPCLTFSKGFYGVPQMTPLCSLGLLARLPWRVAQISYMVVLFSKRASLSLHALN